ncbi:MAG: membrane protein insertion efficiency factor YidD [Clostridia bacterium]|nr:membrane protein insertion efficiency factor YidD [Clostridia bacterium]
MVYIQYIPLRPWIFYTVAGVISYFLLKRFVIGLVLLYKVCAPMEVRGRCRFEPTCSTYMIMAILKYGLVYGVFKGIRRVLRCKPPNGGVDYP